MATNDTKRTLRRRRAPALLALAALLAVTLVTVPADSAMAAGNSITSPDTVGDLGNWGTSLALDTSGNPVISYQEDLGAPRHLKVLHCGDPTCTSGNSITTPDTNTGTRSYSSLVLDATGNPVIAYHGGSNDLRVLHCGNPNCTAANSIASPDTAVTNKRHWHLARIGRLGQPGRQLL